MSDEIDREQTPLRWRLNGAHDDAPPMHADAPAAFEAIETVETLETGETIATEQRLAALATPVAIPVVTPLAPLATKQQLARLVERTDERVERWMADQERGLRAGLDALLTDLERRKAEEVARLDTWIASERARVERELSEEEGRFGRRPMGELLAFEEQLGLRLREQEERIARWWEEADRIAKERFAALGPAPLRTPR